jgi:hypothetical protein
MVTENRSKETALKNCQIFFDYAEWIGRIPRMNSTNKYEKRLSFWLIHMKQARKGGRCIWHEELNDVAIKHGCTGLFEEDGRQRKDFFEVGDQVGPYKVVGKEPCVPEYSQEVYTCMNQKEENVRVSSFVLSSIRFDPNYITTATRYKKFLGKSIGPWTLCGLLGVNSEKGTCWLASRQDEDCTEVVRIQLPCYAILDRFFKKKAGDVVSPVIDKEVGCGVEDMTAKKCGRWTCVGYSHKAVNKECMWLCVCDCGNFSVAAGGKLRNGKSSSCGCFRKDKILQYYEDARKAKSQLETPQIQETLSILNAPSQV